MNTYLIISDTIYYINLKLKELTKGIDNVITFNLEENTIDEVLEEASYFSMFEDNKCVIVKNASFFASTAKESTKNKDCAEKLLKYLENENKNTKLIFITNNADAKKKIYKKILDSGNLFKYEKLTKTEIKNELIKIVKSNKYTIDDESVWYIINNSLAIFDICVNEINKIICYYSKPCHIEYADVVNLCSYNIEDNNFKIVDSIIKRDLNKSLVYLKELDLLKVEPNIIISLLYREFKLMMMVNIYQRSRIPLNNIISNLKIAPWQFEKIENNLRLYNNKEIKEEIVKLSEIDYKLKSGLVSKETVLINYIMDICS